MLGGDGMSLYLVDSERLLAIQEYNNDQYIETGYLIKRNDFSDILALWMTQVQIPQEIIPCRKCRHFIESVNEEAVCDKSGLAVGFDDFCSLGEEDGV